MVTSASVAGRALLSRSEEIAAILRDEILSGQYRPGERLPSERDLSERFDASRGAVREASKKLEQLGIVSIQPGGARVVPITDCTLDVLGPLLDLEPIPDAKLVDEVMQMIGLLMDAAARAAIEKATDDEVQTMQAIIDEMLSYEADHVRRHEALRRLGEFFVNVADHLVLRLMLNGLRTTFMQRMIDLGIQPRLNSELQRKQVNELRGALERRDSRQVGAAMRRLNRLFRDSAREALTATTYARQRARMSQ